MYLTTIVTMVNNIINDNHGSIGQCCLSYCRTLLNIVVLTTRSLIILYLTTIVTMVNNIINDIHGSIGQCCLSYCRTLSNIVVLTTRSSIILYLTTRGLFFLFNDNSDNDWQYYYWYSWEHWTMLLVLLSNIVEHCRFNNKGLVFFI